MSDDSLKNCTIPNPCPIQTRLSPLSYKHVNMFGHYSFTLTEQVVNGQLRPLKKPSQRDD